MRTRRLLRPTSLVLTSLLAACTAPVGDEPEGTQHGVVSAITSHEANILEFRFSAEVVAAPNTEARKAIVSQLMYLQGLLMSAGHGNGQVGQVELSNVNVAEEQRGTKRIKYSASLPVAFPKRAGTPGSYSIVVPASVSTSNEFNSKYDGRCGKSAHGRENFWTDWNPNAQGCSIDDADVVRATAQVSSHPRTTTNKYPEYDRIWADDRLDAVVIFGIIESDKPSDLGYTQLDRFVKNAGELLTGASVRNNSSPGLLKDVTLTGTVALGGRHKEVNVDVLLVREMQRAGSDFDARFDPISEKADLLMYNGHAGLGANVNAFARKGKVARDKYQVVLLNGCQTFAHLETTLNDRRIAANGKDRDPSGTLFMDVVANALQGDANHLANVSTVLFSAIVKADQRRHYNDIVAAMPASHATVVFGEHDNR